MSKTVFYKKIGRRYEPVSEYSDELLDSFSYDTVTMVHCKKNGWSRYYKVDPDFEALDAALMVLREDLVNMMVSVMELRPSKQPFTDRQRELWNELKESFNDQDFYCIRESVYDMAIQFGEKVKERIKNG
jgi:hypothetical protein